MTLQPAEIARYARQMALPGFGQKAQEVLRGAHVALIGTGGLGSPALLYLAGAGVGTITVIDDDVVAVENLHRQVAHSTTGLGTAKADSAAARMRELNPLVEVKSVKARLTPQNALKLLEGADVLLDGADNFPTRHLASWAAAKLGIPHVWGAILGYEAQLSVFWAGHGPIYEDLYPKMPSTGAVPNCAQAGVLGPAVGVVGASMAVEAIKLITGLGTPLIGEIGYYDSLAGKWEYVALDADPHTAERVRSDGPIGAKIVAERPVATVGVSQIPHDAVLVDIREPFEIAQVAIPGHVDVPWSALQNDDAAAWKRLANIVEEAGGPVVLYCRSGHRSAQAWKKIQREHPELMEKRPIYSLAGGIIDWINGHM